MCADVSSEHRYSSYVRSNRTTSDDTPQELPREVGVAQEPRNGMAVKTATIEGRADGIAIAVNISARSRVETVTAPCRYGSARVPNGFCNDHCCVERN